MFGPAYALNAAHELRAEIKKKNPLSRYAYELRPDFLPKIY